MSRPLLLLSAVKSYQQQDRFVINMEWVSNYTAWVKTADLTTSSEMRGAEAQSSRHVQSVSGRF